MPSKGKTILFAEERKLLIVELVDKQRKVTVQELCTHFSASPGTIRNDLQELDNQGLLRRTHGGAISIHRIGYEPKADEKLVVNYTEKQEIAKLAVALIDDGDTIALDTGTTTMELARLLGTKKNLTVVTNDLKIALELEKYDSMTIILTGGVLRRSFHCMVGPQTIENLSEVRVDKAFIAANGISIESGVTTPTFEMADIKRKLIAISSETILLCDSSKIGRVSFKRFAELSEIDKLVTDHLIQPKPLQVFKDAGILVLAESRGT